MAGRPLPVSKRPQEREHTMELREDARWALVVPTSMGVRITPENRQPVQNEFDLDGDHTDEDDDLGARNQRLTGIMQGVARQASLDFDDGMEI